MFVFLFVCLSDCLFFLFAFLCCFLYCFFRLSSHFSAGESTDRLRFSLLEQQENTHKQSTSSRNAMHSLNLPSRSSEKIDLKKCRKMPFFLRPKLDQKITPFAGNQLLKIGKKKGHLKLHRGIQNGHHLILPLRATASARWSKQYLSGGKRRVGSTSKGLLVTYYYLLQNPTNHRCWI